VSPAGIDVRRRGNPVPPFGDNGMKRRLCVIEQSHHDRPAEAGGIYWQADS
jgi:hypothetical protein